MRRWPISFSRACWRIVAFAAMLTLVSGCASRPQAPPAPSPDLPLRQATAMQLRDLLSEQATVIDSLKGLFRAQIQGPGIPGTQQIEGAVLYQRPDTLRLQGYSRIGMKLFELAVGDERYRLRLVNGKVLSGAVADLHRAEQVARPFRLSVLAMSGVIGVEPIPSMDVIELIEEEEVYRLDVYQKRPSVAAGPASPYRQIWFDRRLLAVVREDRLNAVGEVEATVQFDDFRALELPPASLSDGKKSRSAHLTPFHIVAHDPQGPSHIQLKFHEVMPNVAFTTEELQVAGRGTLGGAP